MRNVDDKPERWSSAGEVEGRQQQVSPATVSHGYPSLTAGGKRVQTERPNGAGRAGEADGGERSATGKGGAAVIWGVCKKVVAGNGQITVDSAARHTGKPL